MVVAPGGIADHRGEVADQEDHLVAEVLHLPHLVQHNGVTEMDVRRGGVEAELDAQRACRVASFSATSASTSSSSAPRLKTASWSAISPEAWGLRVAVTEHRH